MNLTLSEECIIALRNDYKIYDEKETKEIFTSMLNQFPLTQWGRIDWDNTGIQFKKVGSKELSKLLNSTKNLDMNMYILWDEVSLPAVSTTLERFLNAIDDVTAVSFDTWIFCSESNYVIEFYHESEIRIGWKKV
ncbi:MAG: hypothetical protein H6Q69_1695 [Firmicutes bacterium]|nr:hypothetical protein [Bacillota bacterium]